MVDKHTWLALLFTVLFPSRGHGRVVENGIVRLMGQRSANTSGYYMVSSRVGGAECSIYRVILFGNVLVKHCVPPLSCRGQFWSDDRTNWQTALLPDHPANNRRCPTVVLMLAQRRRRWANISTTVGQRLVFAGQSGQCWNSLKRQHYAGLMLVHHLRRCPIIKLTYQCFIWINMIALDQCWANTGVLFCLAIT